MAPNTLSSEKGRESGFRSVLGKCQELYVWGGFRGALVRDRYAYIERCFRDLTGKYSVPSQHELHLGCARRRTSQSRRTDLFEQHGRCSRRDQETTSQIPSQRRATHLTNLPGPLSTQNGSATFIVSASSVSRAIFWASITSPAGR
jgi:hypothetical protein